MTNKFPPLDAETTTFFMEKDQQVTAQGPTITARKHMWIFLFALTDILIHKCCWDLRLYPACFCMDIS